MNVTTPDYLTGLWWIWEKHGQPTPAPGDLGPDPLYEYRRWTDGTCPGCDAAEGTLHELGCEFEACPFCGEQAPYCPHCVTEDGRHKKRFLENRAPYIDTPAVCPRCGLVHPEMFMVDTATWRKYVPPYLQKEHLCFACYQDIARWTQAAREGGNA